MCIFAKYKDIFGKPGEGVHAYRLFDIAIVDVVFTVIAAYAISRWLRASFLWTLLVLFVIGELFHVVFGVQTTIVRILSNN